jgi:Ca-activated chloride channel family protein
MKAKLLFALICLVPWFMIPVSAKADGIIVPDPPVCFPDLCPPPPFPISQLEIRYHHVDVFIDNQIATTRVDQVFYNPNEWTVEGTYIFPIPHGSTVNGFTLWIDGKPIKGEVLSAEEARRTYESIVREMQDPALLEYADRGAVRARVFPIPAGGERRIQLEYTQALVADNGLIHYVYPLSTEKFSTQRLDEVRVSVDLRASQPIRAVYSPSHPVAVSREDDYQVRVGFEESNLRPDTDFSLYYSIGESEALHLMSFRDPTDVLDPDGFFLLLLAPRPDAVEKPVPKDVILVLDRSGSMEGEKFRQAQQALKYILQHLNSEDRFNVISFSTGLDTYAGSLQGISNNDEAIAWVERQSAVGSTDINRALLEAAAMADAERPTYLIFLTDGLPTEGVLESEKILNNFASSASDNLRLFAFGVGYDVDTFLLDTLAQEHHGTTTYVLPGEAIDEILSSFYAKVSTPVLMDLALDFGQLVTYDIYPNPLPDLFAGSQIVILGRYREGGRTAIRLNGTVDGHAQDFTFPAQTFEVESSISNLQSSIPRLWATRKIGYLLNQVRLKGPDQELVDQMVRLSIRYGIVTRYTSYLVTEPLPLGEAEQDRIVEETFNNMKSAPAAPSFGQDAVLQAAGEGNMRDAESVSAPPEEFANRVRVVGPRTFLLTDGTWVDTAYDPDGMQTVDIAFLSDDYFRLVATDSQLGAAFALGPRVIALSDGTAYQVVYAESIVSTLEIWPPQPNPMLVEPTLTATPEPLALAAKIDDQVTTTADRGSSTTDEGSSIPCMGGILPLALLSLVVCWSYQKPKKN